MSGEMKYVKTVKVDNDIELEVYELPGGEHVGVEAWYLDQMDTSEIQDPYKPGVAYPVPPVPERHESLQQHAISQGCDCKAGGKET